MTKHAASIQILDVDGLQAAGDQPLNIRVAMLIRRAILTGNLAAGSRLPSSRVLARDLEVSRPTVERAFDELRADGFLVRRAGSGTFVATTLPDRERPPQPAPHGGHPVVEPAEISRRGVILSGSPGRGHPIVATAFTPSLPALELFPRQAWERLMARAMRRSGVRSWEYGPSNGLPELRQAIAAHIGGARAVACAPQQVIVMSSAQQAIDLAARVLTDPGDAAWIEDPCYQPVGRLLRGAGAKVSAIPVDADGLDVDVALAIEPAARIACVTPSHQYPSGGLMSLPRRMALLAWATRERAWILEDDYDGDFRYSGRPLAALQALDPAGRVIYIGTFNKMMFPALRLAFVVVPPPLVEAFTGAKHTMDGHAPGHTQSALAEFIQEGHLAVHLRRLLGEYDRRRVALLSELETLSDELEIGPCDGGMHLAVYLRRALDDEAITAECASLGVDMRRLVRFYAGPARRGFVMGFACCRPTRIHTAMQVVSAAIRTQASTLSAKVVR